MQLLISLLVYYKWQVQILQKVLQLYAAQVLRLKPASKTSSLPESYKFFDDLLESDPELWPALLRKGLFEEKVRVQNIGSPLAGVP